MEAQISRRIVSKREYAAVQAKRGGLTAAALILGIIYVVYVYAAVKYCIWLGLSLALGGTVTGIVPGYFVALVLMPLAFSCIRWMQRSIRAIEFIQRVIPVTRANSRNLPLPDSLVRASTEPVQEQGSILLRAAASRDEKHMDQLLQASMGQR